MIFIHGMNDPSYPRLVDHSMGKRLRVMPAVVVSGARQTGKSTLAGEPTPGRRRYVSLDDINIVDAARRDPGLLVDGDEPVGSIVNQTELGRDVALPQPTVHRHLNLLETSYLLVRLAPYSVNRTKRLVKSPKLHWGDTGVGLHLAGKTEPGGEHLGNLILNDLLAWRDAQRKRSEILYCAQLSAKRWISSSKPVIVFFQSRSRRPGVPDSRMSGICGPFAPSTPRTAVPDFSFMGARRSSGSPRTCWRCRGGGCSETRRAESSRNRSRRPSGRLRAAALRLPVTPVRPVLMELSRIFIREMVDIQFIELTEVDGARSFPIAIGLPEAFAIERRLKDVKIPRPQTHDLLASVIRELGGDLKRIAIHDLADGVFFAHLVIEQAGKTIEVDSRPSDAIALGVNASVPIYVAEHVIDEAIRDKSEVIGDGVLVDDDDEDDDTRDPLGGSGSDDDEDEVEDIDGDDDENEAGDSGQSRGGPSPKW